MGLPFDNVDLQKAADSVREAVGREGQLFLSTPNVNWVVAARSDPAFRNSVIDSDLSIADGMPLIWVAHLLGIPLCERVAGSDLMLVLQREASPVPTSVFFFGGAEDVADEACRNLNRNPGGLRAAGSYYPGFGSIEEMSEEPVIQTINSCHPDFLVVSLGAKKGQAWIVRNRNRLNARVISYLGAVVNFFAGSVERAPLWMQRHGLEWLWRIFQEPGLWRRYLSDGLVLIWLLFTRVLPYVVWQRVFQKKVDPQAPSRCTLTEFSDHTRIEVSGRCTHGNLETVRHAFARAAALKRPCVLDIAGVDSIDGSFIGLLFLLRKSFEDTELRVCNANHRVVREFYWNCAEYLLTKP